MKSAKHHIRRVIGIHSFTFAECCTISQIESILISHPLHLPSDPSDLEALTPRHFLIGRSIVSSPDQDETTMTRYPESIVMTRNKIKQTRWFLRKDLLHG